MMHICSIVVVLPIPVLISRSYRCFSLSSMYSRASSTVSRPTSKPNDNSSVTDNQRYTYHISDHKQEVKGMLYNIDVDGIEVFGGYEENRKN